MLMSRIKMMMGRVNMLTDRVNMQMSSGADGQI
jgi:hypothetical protein